MSNRDINAFHLARQRMVDRQLRRQGIRDERVLSAMGRVPRHFFVEEGLAHRAYSDQSLPIGNEQTISQPYIVARMTEALGLTGNERVLEIGTGSGYQAAVLSELCYRVYSVERLRPLMIRARQVLAEIGRLNVLLRCGDGTLGWADEAPFDAVIVTAGGPEIPRPLVDQVGPGGCLVVPVGTDRMKQNLVKVAKNSAGRVTEHDLGPCRFVDLVGRHGWRPARRL